MPEIIEFQDIFRRQAGPYAGPGQGTSPFQELMRQLEAARTQSGRRGIMPPGQADENITQTMRSLIGEYGPNFFFRRQEGGRIGVNYTRSARLFRDLLRPTSLAERSARFSEMGGIYDKSRNPNLRALGARYAQFANVTDLASQLFEGTRGGGQIEALTGGLAKGLLAAQAAAGTLFGQAAAGAQTGAVAGLRARIGAALVPHLAAAGEASAQQPFRATIGTAARRRLVGSSARMFTLR